MITYEQAKKKALAQDKNLDTVIEYDKAYVFYNSKARGNEAEDNEIVVLKENGNMISYGEYVMTTTDDDKKKKVSKI